MSAQKKLLLLIILTAFLIPCFAKSGSDDFYAYYTRLDYNTPLQDAIYSIPLEISEESKQILRAMKESRPENEEEDEDEESEGESEELNRPISGKFADIIVNLADNRQLIFSRKTSYLPVWKTETGTWSFPEIVSRQKDIACLYSYARIIESRPDHILIQWRYIPNLKNVNGFTDPVYEFFVITPAGKVLRKIKKANKKLALYNDSANVTTQTLQLKQDGINVLSTKKAKLTEKPAKEITGSLLKTKTVASPAAWWKFDEGTRGRPFEKRNLTQETVSGKNCKIDGNVTLWKKGASGSALAFDGYNSKVSLPAANAPKINDQVTLEAWVTLGAYPWNWAPLVHQSIVEPGPIEKGNYDNFGKTQQRKKAKGYYLGINAYGYPIFSVDGKTVKSSAKIQTYKWTHITGAYGNGNIKIYINGSEAGSVTAQGKINIPTGTDLLIGLNNQKGRATDPVRGPMNHLPKIYGIEGLIDEVKIYDTALDAAEVKQDYENSKPAASIENNPDLQPRILPGNPGTAKSFGAHYTRLKYHDLWDNLWRPSPYDDVLVKFDSMPTSIAYWRGANCAPGWVTEKNYWMEDQSCETGGPHGCSEHMADKQCRHAHVRIIENNPARVVIHWRYASIDVDYVFPSPRHWADEYHTIYPDGTAVRKVYFYSGNPGWQDIQYCAQPGKSVLDFVNLQALTFVNLDGNVKPMTWKGSNGIPKNTLPDACAEWINYKSDYKIFLIFQKGTHINPWGRAEQSPYTKDPFAGPWNHWPVGQMPSDGRFAVAHDRITHGAFAAADNVTEHGNMAIYGFTNLPPATLVPLARFWNNPPEIANTDGCESFGYDKAQRNYILEAKSYKSSFAINASEDSPLVNPCFVIENWKTASDQADVQINGKKITPGKNLRKGITRNIDGKPKLVIWLKYNADSPVTFQIIKK